MDQLVLRRLVQELDARLRDCRIDSAYALPRYHLALRLSLPGAPRLWFSAEPDEPHLYLRPGGHGSPQRPPAFAMALRKHARGRRIAALRLLGEDRVVEISWRGDSARLVLELLPRRASASLIDGDGAVVAVWNPRRGRPEPGAAYTPPPRTTRTPATEVSSATWAEIAAEPTRARGRALMRHVDGVTPMIAAEALTNTAAGRDLPAALAEALAHAEAAAGAPMIYSAAPIDSLRRAPAPGKLILAPFELRAAANMCARRFDDLISAAAEYYALRARLRFTDSVRAGLAAQIRERRARLQRALERMGSTPDDEGAADRLRREGDLLLAHPRAPVSGEHVRVPDDYGDGSPIELRIDPALDLAANAQRRYHRARRLERKRRAEQTRRAQLDEELRRLDDLDRMAEEVDGLGACERLVAAAARQGLTLRADRLREPEAGAALADDDAGDARGARQSTSGILVVRARGAEILVGRNARANDRLTHELARRHDWWLHAEGPGSHVVLRNPRRGEAPPQKHLEAAAALAAWFSKSRAARHVEVRWTQARQVRRAPGGRPGAALLDEWRTVRVRPRSPADLATD